MGCNDRAGEVEKHRVAVVAAVRNVVLAGVAVRAAHADRNAAVLGVAVFRSTEPTCALNAIVGDKGTKQYEGFL